MRTWDEKNVPIQFCKIPAFLIDKMEFSAWMKISIPMPMIRKINCSLSVGPWRAGHEEAGPFIRGPCW